MFWGLGSRRLVLVFLVNGDDLYTYFNLSDTVKLNFEIRTMY